MSVIFRLCVKWFFFCFCVSAMWRLDFLCRLVSVLSPLTWQHCTDCSPSVTLQSWQLSIFVLLRVHHIISSEPLYKYSHLSQQWPRSSAPTLCCVIQASPFVCMSAQKQLHWWISLISTAAWQDISLIIPVQNSCFRYSALPGRWPWFWNQLWPSRGSMQYIKTQHNNNTGGSLTSHTHFSVSLSDVVPHQRLSFSHFVFLAFYNVSNLLLDIIIVQYFCFLSVLLVCIWVQLCS